LGYSRPPTPTGFTTTPGFWPATSSISFVELNRFAVVVRVAAAFSFLLCH
jgi:hypothetical protein